MPISAEGTLRLWQLISPNLPVGAYSYSNGLEQVIETGDVRNEGDVAQWLDEVLSTGLARTDLPVLMRVQRAVAVGDIRTAMRWCRKLLAMRETSELRFADRSMGDALARLLEDLGVRMPEGTWPFAGAFGFAAAHWGMPIADAAAGFAWSWCESHVAAAIKLVPLGHTAGQRLMLGRTACVLAAVASAARIDDGQIGFGMPGLAIASARHETQYTRLFRS
jgi:urease accessory protein